MECRRSLWLCSTYKIQWWRCLDCMNNTKFKVSPLLRNSYLYPNRTSHFNEVTPYLQRFLPKHDEGDNWIYFYFYSVPCCLCREPQPQWCFNKWSHENLIESDASARFIDRTVPNILHQPITLSRVWCPFLPFTYIYGSMFMLWEAWTKIQAQTVCEKHIWCSDFPEFRFHFFTSMEAHPSNLLSTFEVQIKCVKEHETVERFRSTDGDGVVYVCPWMSLAFDLTQ